MKITRKQLRQIIKEEISRINENTEEEQAEVIDVVDPCEIVEATRDEFIAAHPLWPPGLGEMFGQCGNGIYAAQIEFSDGTVANVTVESDEPLSIGQTLSKSEVKEMVSPESGTPSATAMSKEDQSVLDKQLPDMSLNPGQGEWNYMEVTPKGPQGSGTYYYKDGELVHFSPHSVSS